LDNSLPGENWQPGIQTIRQVPLLYVVTPKFTSEAAYLRRVDPLARVEIFENSGQALFVDEPDRFNALMEDFLRHASLYPAGLPRVTPPAKTAVLTSPSSPIPTAKPVSSIHPPPTIPLSPTANPTAFPKGITTPRESTFTPTASPLPTLTPVPAPRSTKPSWNLMSFLKNHPLLTPKQPTAKTIQEGYFLTSDHVRLHYLEAGRGMALVFIPGWLLPAEIWTPQLEGLSQYYHVVALDPRSQGKSDITPLGDEPSRQAKDIQELLDHLQLSSVVLVGWSHGAFHVLSYMNQFGTDRLYAAVLVDSSLAAASSPPSSASQARFLDQLKNDRLKAVRGFVRGLFKTTPPADFFNQLTEAAARTPVDIALALMNNVFPGESWQPSLQTIRQVPLLYAVTPKFASQAAYLKNVDNVARVVIFEHSGHALFVDESKRFNDLMRDFLRQASLYPAGLSGPRRRQAGQTFSASHPGDSAAALESAHSPIKDPQ
jgi:microsomal epoxide hydrolase